MHTMQVRNYTRRSLELPILFDWRDKRGVRCRGDGITRDVSAGGIFLFTKTCPPAGIKFEFELFLPKISEQSSIIRVQGEGRVLRVELPREGEERSGFAAAHMEFVLRSIEKES